MSAKAVARVAFAALLIAAIVWIRARPELLDAAGLRSSIREFGALGPLAFMAIYIIGTLAFAPGSLLTLAGGALFGPLWGTLYSLTAATVGATLAFLLARTLAGDWVRTRVGPGLDRILVGVEAEGWRFVAFLRLVPLFPFNLLNYALGLTRIGPLAFAGASYVFMAPGCAAYTYLGYLGGEAATGAGDLVRKSLVALALLAGATLLPRFARRLRGEARDSAQANS